LVPAYPVARGFSSLRAAGFARPGFAWAGLSAFLGPLVHAGSVVLLAAAFCAVAHIGES
jgi:hypothetical protein